MTSVEVNVNYYIILEISNTATLEVVIKSYRRLTKIRHSDKNLNKNNSTVVFQLVSPMHFKLTAVSEVDD